jgi:hypothetical protein
VAVALSACLAASGCGLFSAEAEAEADQPAVGPPQLSPTVTDPGSTPVDAPDVGSAVSGLTIVAGDASTQARAVSRALWRSSPLVVVAPGDDRAAVSSATEAARELAAPLLLSTDDTVQVDLLSELERLGARTLLVLGDDPDASWVPDGLSVETSAGSVLAQQPRGSVEQVVLAADTATTAAARATAQATGATVVVLPGDDPRESPAAIEALSASPDSAVLAIGGRLGPAPRLAPLVEVAASGVTLPGGGQTLFPGRRLVALYGHPATSALGVLGEKGPGQSVQRARRLAQQYGPFSDEPVVPAFELIATVASDVPGPDGDYSNETPIELLRPYVDAAADAGVYVVLDLQPGRAGFVSQAKEYRELLLQAHVGLALDPEWRLGPGELPLRQIGTVDVEEVEAAADWLARLVRTHALPQKLLLLHQFQQRMIEGRERLDAQRDELAVVVQMDGDGTPGEKRATWQALKQDAPPGLRFGWKNFYDEDTPTFTPEQTMAVTPTPWWVSYQ